jgi:hypothetical protein
MLPIRSGAFEVNSSRGEHSWSKMVKITLPRHLQELPTPYKAQKEV